MVKKLLGHHRCDDCYDYYRNFICRIHSFWLIKAIGITSGISLFFIGYFHFQKHQYYAVTNLHFSALDMLIPFHISFVYIYASLWIYISLVPGLMKNLRELIFYGVYASIISIIGLLFYAFYPTVIVQNVSLWHNIPQMMELKSVDTGGNAFPSLHVAFAIFTFIWLKEQLGQMKAKNIFHIFNTICAIAITYSTLAIKQHLIIDVIAGILLGMVVGIISIWHYRRISTQLCT